MSTRPTLSNLYREAWSLSWRHGRTVLLPAVLTTLTSSAILQFERLHRNGPMSFALLLLSLFTVVIGFAVGMGITNLALSRYDGRPATFRTFTLGVRRTLPMAPIYFYSAMVYAFVAFAVHDPYALLFAVPLVIIATRLSLSYYYLLEGRLGMVASLLTAWKQSKSIAWLLAGVVLPMLFEGLLSNALLFPLDLIAAPFEALFYTVTMFVEIQLYREVQPAQQDERSLTA